MNTINTTYKCHQYKPELTTKRDRNGLCILNTPSLHLHQLTRALHAAKWDHCSLFPDGRTRIAIIFIVFSITLMRTCVPRLLPPLTVHPHHQTSSSLDPIPARSSSPTHVPRQPPEEKNGFGSPIAPQSKLQKWILSNPLSFWNATGTARVFANASSGRQKSPHKVSPQNQVKIKTECSA